jgi:hypothetical protein
VPPLINPTDNPDQIAAERDAIALLESDIVRDGRQQVDRLWRSGWADSIPDEVRPYFDSMVDEYLANWVFKAVSSDGNYPRLVRNFCEPYSWHGHNVPGTRAAGENPDNVYRMAGIYHGNSYKISGRPVGIEPANVSLTLTGNYGTTVTIQTLESHQLQRAPDGSFEITVDDLPANGRANHMTTAPGVKFLYVRDSMDDWERETPLDLQIQLVSTPKADPLTHEMMAREAVRRASEDVFLYFWYQSGFLNIAPNVLHNLPVAHGTGGLVTQGLTKGHFNLGDDEAAIIEYEPAGAAYVAVQLTNWIFRSLDADRCTSSLTRAQSIVDSDGKVRLVIARRDPGVANWLDCRNFREVIYMHRWQGLPGEPANGGPHALGRVVKLDQLHRDLPPETVWFDKTQRSEQLARRKAAYDRRFALNSR